MLTFILLFVGFIVLFFSLLAIHRAGYRKGYSDGNEWGFYRCLTCLRMDLKEKLKELDEHKAE